MSFWHKLFRRYDRTDDLLSQAERINDYFANAVRVYALKGDRAAKAAALAAAKVAAEIQRNSMIHYLVGMAIDLKAGLPDKDAFETIAKRLASLEAAIKIKDWTVQDIIEEKALLAEINPDYLSALNKADPDIFKFKHPDLFLDS